MSYTIISTLVTYLGSAVGRQAVGVKNLNRKECHRKTKKILPKNLQKFQRHVYMVWATIWIYPHGRQHT